MENKIYNALRKICNKSNRAITTNSEYFIFGPIRVRVSDHSTGEMSCSNNKMYVLINANKPNLYTVCFGRKVQLCTLREVVAICKSLKVLGFSLSSLLNIPEEASLEDRQVAHWSQMISDKNFLKENGYDVSNFTKSELSKLKLSFGVADAPLSIRKAAMDKVYSQIVNDKFNKYKTILLKPKPSERVQLLSKISGVNYDSLKIQQKTYVGMLLNHIKSYDDLKEVIVRANKFIK